MFVTFEGIDGSGKSTQARKLVEYLREQGHEVVLTREPGGSPGAEEIRRMLVEGDADRWSPETELLLFNAARRDHLERVIRPALKLGNIVISDRFADSTRAYQGVARGDLRALADQLHVLMIGDEPDLTLIIDIAIEEMIRRQPTQEALDANKAQEQRFEKMGIERALRDAFLSIAQEPEYATRCVVIDGSGTVDEVFARVLSVFEARL